jgi:hypothetical protein
MENIENTKWQKKSNSLHQMNDWCIFGTQAKLAYPA